MKHLITISLVVAALLCSCAPETMSEAVENQNNINFSLQFNTRTTDESSINTLRVVVVAESDQRITCNRTYSSDQIATPTPDTFSVNASARPGKSIIYVIANEPTASTPDLDAMKVIDELPNIKIPFTPLTAINGNYDGGIPMMGQCNYDISPIPSANHIQSIELEKLLTKISMQFKASPGLENKVKITGIRLDNAPKHSYLLAKKYEETDFAITAIMPILEEMIVGKTETTPIEFYAPEYSVNDEDLHSYVTVIGERIVDKVMCTYTIPLGEKMCTDVVDGTSDLIRNTHYEVVGTIKGYGHTDFDIKVSVSPWNTVAGGSEVGEHITTNNSSVDLIHTTNNTSLKVFSNNLNTVKVTFDDTKIDAVKFNKSTGVVTINAKYDYSIGEPIKNWTSITFKQGEFKKEVTVNYEPIVWAPGDIALGLDDRYVIGWEGNERTLLFMFGSKIGLEFAHLPNNTAPWSTTSKYYIPGENLICESKAGLSIDEIKKYARGSSGLGDPCAFIVSNVKWRTPTKDEFLLLNNPAGTSNPSPITGIPAYEFSSFKNSDGSNVWLFSYFMGKGESGRTEGYAVGYYWSITPYQTAVSMAWTFIANNDSGALTRINIDNFHSHFKVRCVRNFE